MSTGRWQEQRVCHCLSVRKSRGSVDIFVTAMIRSLPQLTVLFTK